MGNDEVFELITERKIPIMYDNDEFDEFNIFENNSEYRKVINDLVTFYPNHISLQKLNDNLKTIYFELVKEHGEELKQELDKHFERTKTDFNENYNEIVNELFYPIAAVDNMMFDLDKKLEDKTKIKVKK